MTERRRRLLWGGESGQVAVAFVAVVPALILVALGLLQFALAGHAALSAANAARAAARAEYVGADPERAVRAALPPGLRSRAEVSAGRDRVEVEVRAPRGLPFGPSVPVTAATRLGPSGGVLGG